MYFASAKVGKEFEFARKKATGFLRWPWPLSITAGVIKKICGDFINCQLRV